MLEDLSTGRILNEKNWGYGVISEKTEVLYAELSQRAEATIGSYSVTGDSLQYIYSVPVTKNHRNTQIFFNDIDHGYRAAILKENFLLLLFYMVMVTYFYYEGVRRTMRTATVSNLKEKNYFFFHAYTTSSRNY